MNTPRIIPRGPRLVADVLREAKAARSAIKIMRNRVVMLPRKAANQDFPEAA